MYSDVWVSSVGVWVVSPKLSTRSSRRVGLSETVSQKPSLAIVDWVWVLVGLVHIFAVAEKEEG